MQINDVFESVVKQTEGKFIYLKAGADLNNGQVKQTLELLIQAGLVYPVTHSSTNRIPLGAEAIYTVHEGNKLKTDGDNK